MKKIILIIILFLSLKVFPQSGWVPVTLPNDFVSSAYVNFDFINEATGYIAKSKIYKSTNGGFNWSPISTTISDGTKLKFFNSGTGYILNGGNIAKTTNHGENWSPLNFNNISFIDFFFLSENTGFALNSGSGADSIRTFVYKTTNGGINWTKYFVRNIDYSNRVFFCNNQVGYIGGGGIISKTTDGGVSWFDTGGQCYVTFGFAFPSENNGWAIADSFRVVKTTDGGVNWIRQYQNKARDIFFLNDFTGWYCLDKVYKTTDAGVNWTATSNTVAAFWKVKFINENTGWAYSGQNVLYITHNGGNVFIQSENSEVPDKFYLSQNYPNPFNPETKIKFRIAKKDIVKLDVYDVTGKIVMQIVNGELNAGTYSFNFSGKDMNSGIYFYKMQTTNYSETKRMMLVK